LAERQAISGCPQIGHVISEDLPALTRAARREQPRDFGVLQAGLDFLR
jgi:hypothetical protein